MMNDEVKAFVVTKMTELDPSQPWTVEKALAEYPIRLKALVPPLMEMCFTELSYREIEMLEHYRQWKMTQSFQTVRNVTKFWEYELGFSEDMKRTLTCCGSVCKRHFSRSRRFQCRTCKSIYHLHRQENNPGETAKSFLVKGGRCTQCRPFRRIEPVSP